MEERAGSRPCPAEALKAGSGVSYNVPLVTSDRKDKFMALLNLPNNQIPPAFVQALAKAEQANQILGAAGAAITLDTARNAIRLLCESNQLLINALTEHKIK